MIIIMTAFKGADQDILLQSPQCASNCLQNVRSSGPGVIVCKACATHRAFITCNMSLGTKGQLSYWVWQNWNCIYFSAILLTETINRWMRGRNWSTQRKPLKMSFRNCHILKPKNSKLQVRLEPTVYHWWQARKADVLTIPSRITPKWFLKPPCKFTHAWWIRTGPCSFLPWRCRHQSDGECLHHETLPHHLPKRCDGQQRAVQVSPSQTPKTRNRQCDW